jgi:hypothetical protein
MQLENYEKEFGTEEALAVLDKFEVCFFQQGWKSNFKKFKGIFFINQAFTNYRASRYKKVPSNIVKAIASQPSYLRNRGVLSILIRSIFEIR